MFDPRISRHLIADQGEVVIDEVRKHWAAAVSAILELLAGIVVFLFSFLVPIPAQWLPVLLSAGLVLHSGWRILDRHMDRFVITNMRVFRVHGILSQRIATMPLARILDISVHKPLIGRMLGYGHFVFESAAQAQGLREIRFVGHPDERGLTIQRVIQQAGLRGFAGQNPGEAHAPRRPSPAPIGPASPEVSGTPAAPASPRPPVPGVPAAVAAAAAAPSGHEGSPARGWEWLAAARAREDARLAELQDRGAPGPLTPFDPDRTTTAPIDLER